jgi:hypothetical protein
LLLSVILPFIKILYIELTYKMGQQIEYPSKSFSNTKATKENCCLIFGMAAMRVHAGSQP